MSDRAADVEELRKHIARASGIPSVYFGSPSYGLWQINSHYAKAAAKMMEHRRAMAYSAQQLAAYAMMLMQKFEGPFPEALAVKADPWGDYERG